MSEPQDDDSPLRPNEVLDDNYVIAEELGRGGIGVVYKAYDRGREEDVAIKVLLSTWAADRKMVERFLREGRLAIRARHPNIVQVYAIGRRKGSGIPYFVMEFVEGETLLQRLKRARDQGTTIGMAGIHIGRQLLSALAATHQKGIVHRGPTPS
jgi:serine/threonine protein kinase